MPPKRKKTTSKNKRQNKTQAGGEDTIKDLRPAVDTRADHEGTTSATSVGEDRDKVNRINVTIEEIREPETATVDAETENETGPKKEENRSSTFSEGLDGSVSLFGNGPASVVEKTEVEKEAEQSHLKATTENSTVDSTVHPALRTPTSQPMSIQSPGIPEPEQTESSQVTKSSSTSLLVPELTVTTSTPATSRTSSPSPPPLPSTTTVTPQQLQPPRRIKSLEETKGPSLAAGSPSHHHHKRHGQVFFPTSSSSNPYEPEEEDDDDENEPLASVRDRLWRPQSLRSLRVEQQQQQIIDDAITPCCFSSTTTTPPYAPRPSFQVALSSLSRTPPSLKLHSGPGFRHNDGFGRGDDGRFPKNYVDVLNMREVDVQEKKKEGGVEQMRYDGRNGRGVEGGQHIGEQQPQRQGEGKASPVSRFGKWLGGCVHFGGSTY
jgi:hypothetical protein